MSGSNGLRSGGQVLVDQLRWSRGPNRRGAPIPREVPDLDPHVAPAHRQLALEGARRAVLDHAPARTVGMLARGVERQDVDDPRAAARPRRGRRARVHVLSHELHPRVAPRRTRHGHGHVHAAATILRHEDLQALACAREHDLARLLVVRDRRRKREGVVDGELEGWHDSWEWRAA